MRQLDWTNCRLNLTYSLDFFSEDHALAMRQLLEGKSTNEAVDFVLEKAPQDRMIEIGLDAAKLIRWVDVAYSLQNAAIDYEPRRNVECLDVFYAIPLAAVARTVDEWLANHLSKWDDFCTTAPRFHRVEGAHYTMISPKHVLSFQKTLKAVLKERGV